jgi:hypothetical protein
METNWSSGQPPDAEPASNVVDFAARARAVQPEPFFSDAERREIREMLAYYRVARPQFEALKMGCPTARYLLTDE